MNISETRPEQNANRAEDFFGKNKKTLKEYIET